MKKTIYLLNVVTILLIISCKNNIKNDIPFEIANNYFIKSNIAKLPSNKFTNQKDFDKVFGMAVTMENQPIKVDFSNQFVIAVDSDVTDMETIIVNPNLSMNKDTLSLKYEVKKGERQSFSMHPVLLLIVDKKYADTMIKIMR